MNNDEFINKSILKHGNKYDYSPVEYKGSKLKIKIICPIHGEFSQVASEHLRGRGCQKCANENKIYTIEDITEKSKKIYGSKYEIVSREGNTINFICKEHGLKAKKLYPFIQGIGCDECGKINMSKKQAKTLEKFIEEANLVHNNKYQYDKVVYVNTKTKVTIICPVHGEFSQQPLCHLQGQGCPKCGREQMKISARKKQDDFIKEAKTIHGNKYDYSKSNYVNEKTKIVITCPIHGDFLQTPEKHILRHQGCPICGESNFENIVRRYLEDNNIIYETEKKFSWSNRKRFDFYLSEYNTLIECQGLQHFKENDFFGGINGLMDTINRDRFKNKMAKENNFNILYYIPFNISDLSVPDFYKKENIFSDTVELKSLLS